MTTRGKAARLQLIVVPAVALLAAVAVAAGAQPAHPRHPRDHRLHGHRHHHGNPPPAGMILRAPLIPAAGGDLPVYPPLPALPPPAEESTASLPGEGERPAQGERRTSAVGPPPVEEPSPPPVLPPPVEVPSAGTTEEPAAEEAPSPPPADPGSRLFTGVDIGDFALQQAAPGAITEVPDPLSGERTVLQMTVADGDVYPVTPTADPRAQLLSPEIFESGDEFWWSSEFLLPADFPASVPGWVTLLEGPYGAPFDGTPPWHIEASGDTLRWSRNGTYDWDVPWQMPLARGRWVHILVHQRFAPDAWVEMWVDGKPVTFFSGNTFNPGQVAPTRRLEMQTLDSSNDGAPNFAVIQSYRQAGMFESLTVYQGPMRLGETRASVGG